MPSHRASVVVVVVAAAMTFVLRHGQALGPLCRRRSARPLSQLFCSHDGSRPPSLLRRRQHSTRPSPSQLNLVATPVITGLHNDTDKLVIGRLEDDGNVDITTESNMTASTKGSNADVSAPALLHPNDFLDKDGRMPYPKHLSPSSAMAFKDCPQSFLLQYIYKLQQPTNVALAKGSMCHTALEHIFDLDPPDRTLENLQNMLRVTWGEHRLRDEYRFLFEQDDEEGVGGTVTRNLDAEREWGQSALRLLENYYLSEDPREVVRPNPYRREVWVHANLTVDASLGVTAPQDSSTAASTVGASGTKASHPEAFKVRGIVDRLDMVKQYGRKVALKIVDYKTGKAPNLKYSQTMNQHIYQKNFYQLKIYALLMREKAAKAATAAAYDGSEQDSSGSTSVGSGMDLRYLKLYYLDSETGRAKPWEMDLGETQEERDEVLYEVHQDLAQIWKDIIALVDTQDPKAFRHCDRSFCYCHTCRPRFVPGTLWKDNKSTPALSTTTMPIVPEIG